MKKWVGLILTFFMFLCWGYPRQVQALDFGKNITIYDKSSGNQGGYYVPLWHDPHTEDQEVEPGCNIGQVWDLEGMFLSKTSAKLTMVGGWNFKAIRNDFGSGDIFIDTNGDAVYGFGVPYGQTSNTFYKYEYVLHVADWINSNTYDVYKLNSATVVQVHYWQNAGSNPWAYASGGTPVSGWQGKSFTYLDNLTDSDTPGFTGGTHYAVTFDLGFLKPDERNIIAHFTQKCGNDNLMGQGTVVPIPGAVLLLGAGLARMVAYVRRRQD